MVNIAHLETDVTQACQLSCVACNHAVPLWRTKGVWTATPEGVAKDLNYLATFLHTEAWGALGGEPLLNKRLPEILRVVKGTGIADKIEVWTNGLLVKAQTEAFWLAPFDDLVVSVYSGKLTDAQLEDIAVLCRAAGKRFVMRDERTQTNFMTFLEPAPTNPSETRKKFAVCSFKRWNRVASYGYVYMCCCGPHIPYLIQDQPYGTDGMKIEGSTEADLRAYLTRTEPLGACTICAGRETAKRIPWSEERQPLLWLKKSAGG